MFVDQDIGVGLCKECIDCFGIDVYDCYVFVLVGILVVFVDVFDDGFVLCQWYGQELLLVSWLLYLCVEGYVGLVIGVLCIVMGQCQCVVGSGDDVWVFQQGQFGGIGKGLFDQEIVIVSYLVQLYVLYLYSLQCVSNQLVVGSSMVVVIGLVFEYVIQ